MYLSTFAFIEHRFGPNGRESVMKGLTDADRAMFGGIMLPISWYPLAPFGRLLRVMDGQLGRGDLSLVTDRGEWTATRDLHTLRKALLKLVSIPWIITRAAGLWPQFHDTGRWEVKKTSPTTAVAELHELGVIDDAICASVRGWILGLAKLPGTARTVEIRHAACRSKGDAVCVYEMTWQDR